MLRSINRRGLLGAMAGSVVLLGSGMVKARARARANGGPAAVAEGPIPVTADTGEPFRGGSDQPIAGPGLPIPDLAAFDYVEEEYFISGTVAGEPYRTSILVRKPRDPTKFSGLVAVETIHSLGAIPLWGLRIWMSGGHGWVAVASQLTALRDQVVRSNSRRYAGLTLPIAPADPSQAMPMADRSAGPQDRISQDIMTQLGRMLKSNSRRGPFAGMRVRHLLMGGSSQTGGTTLRYIQESHERARLGNGRPIYDAYFAAKNFPTTPLPATDAAIVHYVAEGDLINRLRGNIFGSGPIAYRQDSDGTDRFRHYQIPGMSHVDTRGAADLARVFPLLGNALRPGEVISQFPVTELMSSIAGNLVDWVLRGTPPPRAPRIEVADGEIVRDALGNAMGGVRSPWVDLPTVRYIAAAPTVAGDSLFRRLIGLDEPIPPARLRQMYGTRERYLARFNEQIDRMVAGRWLRAEYAPHLKSEEARRELF